MRKTTEYADSIYDLLRPKVMRLFNNRGSFLKHFRALAECSILGSIIVYFVGTTILLLRNLLSGLPFVPLSIIQAAVITVYFCVFVVAYIVVEHIVCKMWRKKRESISFWRKVGCVFCLIIVVAACMLISVAILWLFLRNAILPLLLIVSFFLLVPCALRICYRFFEKSQDCTWAVLYVIVFAAFVMIWTLPSSVGGLGSQKVAYYDDSGVCQEYDYYGVADEMLVLINNNKVSLIPIGDGHIEYVVSRYSFFGPKEDEQKACGVDPVNSAPDADL